MEKKEERERERGFEAQEPRSGSKLGSRLGLGFRARVAEPRAL